MSLTGQNQSGLRVVPGLWLRAQGRQHEPQRRGRGRAAVAGFQAKDCNLGFRV